MSNNSHPNPVQPQERIQTIDILRGFALLGILLVNMELFNNSVFLKVMGGHEPATTLDQLARWFIAFFAEGKFYSMFSFLFGLGMAIQFQRAEAKGIPFVGTYARRLLVLLGIGIVHAYLFWIGDILMLYAVLGFALLFLFRKAKPRTVLIWSAVCLLIPIIINAGLWGLIALSELAPGGTEMMTEVFDEQMAEYAALGAQSDTVYATGTFAEVTQQRTAEMNFMYTILPFMGFNVLATMLLGLYVGKRRIMEDIPAHLPLIRRVLWWGLVIGLLGNLAYVWAGELSNRAIPSFLATVSAVGQTFGAPALSLFYMASLTLLVQNSVAWRGRLAPLAAAGRMAMTNYLMQTIICTTLFYGYGFGQYGIGIAAGILLTFVIYGIELVWSGWWLGRFRFGPLEWLWRTLTYLTPQPMVK